MKPTPQLPTAAPALKGLILFFGVAPALILLGSLLGVSAVRFFSVLAFLAGSVGLGFLIQAAYAFFTTYDSVAARFLAGAVVPPTTAPAPSGPAPSAAVPSEPGAPPAPPAIRIPTSAEALAGPNAAPRRPAPAPDADMPHRPVMPPLPGRTTAPSSEPSEVSIVATPPPPEDDEA